jgi:redox-sensitive bicupin YhaK (pirin superfamily)
MSHRHCSVTKGGGFYECDPQNQKNHEGPRYRDVKAADIPEERLESGISIKVVAGTVGNVQGPVKDIVIDPEMLDISIPPGNTFQHPLPPGHTAFAYILSGEGYFDECRDAYAHETASAGWWDTERHCVCQPETVVLLEHEGDVVQVTTTGKPVRFLLVSGKPINEPVAWYGPIVMNTKDELRVAFEEYQQGTFIKHK